MQQLSVQSQIEAIREAYDRTFFPKFQLPEPSPSELRHFSKMAPPPPTDVVPAVRLPRIRFDKADAGVTLTWEAHLAHIASTLGPQLTGWRLTRARAKWRVRLLGGNHTHHPGLTWGKLYLNANRRRRSISQVRRSPEQTPRSPSAADELLVFAWMFPDEIRSIGERKRPGLCLAGYEYNQHADPQEWQRVPLIGPTVLLNGHVEIGYVANSWDGECDSVPIFSPSLP